MPIKLPPINTTAMKNEQTVISSSSVRDDTNIHLRHPNQAMPSTSPMIKASRYDLFVASQLKIVHNHLLWLYTDILYRVVILKCPCGVCIGLDEHSMSKFMKFLVCLIKELSSAVVQKNVIPDLKMNVEKWMHVLKYYDVVVRESVCDTHITGLGDICNILVYKIGMYEELTKRKECIKKTIHVLMQLKAFEQLDEIELEKHPNVDLKRVKACDS